MSAQKGPQTLTALLELLQSWDIPLGADLPTFGGLEPSRTEGVWSWDATHTIVGECPSDLEMVPR